MNIKNFSPDLVASATQIAFLSGRRDSQEVFQIYPDSPLSTVKPTILIGSIYERFNELCAFNLQGAAISVVVNETDLKGRSAQNIVRVRSLFTDDDHNLNKPISLDPPSFTVHSKAGPHKYYLFRDVALQQFQDMQRMIAFDAETDAKVSDLGRPMRLAGFYHMKDPSDPFLVSISSLFMADLEKVLNGNSI